MLKIFKTRLILAVSFLAIAITFSVISYYAVSKNDKNLTKNFNNELKLFAKLSTRAVVQNYELYFDSGNFKFNEVASDIIGQNESIKRIDILDTDGKILFSSNENFNLFELKSEEKKEPVSGDILDAVRSLEATQLYDDSEAVRLIISPHVEDWGAHKYSVRYIISSEKLNRDIELFRNGVILAGTLLFILIFIPLFGVLYYREFALTKEESLRLENLNRQKDDFMTLVAHNLRTPISIMKGYTNLAEEKSLSKIENEYLKAVAEGAEELNKVTEAIISVTGLLSGETLIKEEVDFQKIITNILAQYKKSLNKKKIKVSVNIKEKFIINGDEKYLKNAVSSLVDNAVKFNKDKGTIDISIKKEKELFSFEISDSGIGIKNDDLENIFSSFRRSVKNTLDYDYSGLGMGLYLTKVIIEAHGGKIWAKSVYNEGSTFGFSLPL